MSKSLSALIIGPTDKSKLYRCGHIKQEELKNFYNKTSIVLKKNISNLIMIADDGVPLEIGKAFKKNGGKKLVGYLPKQDYNKLTPYFKFFDEIKHINGGWVELNTCLSLNSSLIIGLGLSPGTIVEMAYTKYHNKYLNKEIRILLDKRTISTEIPRDIAEELELIYFNSYEELDKQLKKIRREYE